jgi:hypothetical protein
MNLHSYLVTYLVYSLFKKKDFRKHMLYSVE